MAAKRKIASFLLVEERAPLFGLFLLPFRNALMKGATMDEEAAIYIKKIRWFGLIGCIIMLLSIEPTKIFLPFFLAVFLFLCGISLQIALIGYENKDIIPSNKVAMFDLGVAKSGGLWAVLGLGLWSLFNILIGS